MSGIRHSWSVLSCSHSYSDKGMTIVDSGSHEGYPPETLIFVDVSIAFNTRGRTLRELYDWATTL